MKKGISVLTIIILVVASIHATVMPPFDSSYETSGGFVIRKCIVPTSFFVNGIEQPTSREIDGKQYWNVVLSFETYYVPAADLAGWLNETIYIKGLFGVNIKKEDFLISSKLWKQNYYPGTESTSGIELKENKFGSADLNDNTLEIDANLSMYHGILLSVILESEKQGYPFELLLIGKETKTVYKLVFDFTAKNDNELLTSLYEDYLSECTEANMRYREMKKNLSL